MRQFLSFSFLDIFFAEHSSTGVGECEDDESLFDNESCETWEEDAEKLNLFEFTATVLFLILFLPVMMDMTQSA